MKFFKVVEERRSIRKYKDKPVSDEDLKDDPCRDCSSKLEEFTDSSLLCGNKRREISQPERKLSAAIQRSKL